MIGKAFIPEFKHWFTSDLKIVATDSEKTIDYLTKRH